MDAKQKANWLENLAILYLRLNGYFTTSFIVHSDEKKIASELDIMAVRFPYHSQNDTDHGASAFLELNNSEIDIIIGEVKSHRQRSKFNDSIREVNNVESLKRCLRWIGIFTEGAIKDIANEVIDLMNPEENLKSTELPSTKVIPTDFGSVRIRPLIFKPETKTGSDLVINWTEIDDFIWMCLCPEIPRELCNTDNYTLTAWGPHFEHIVAAYKNRSKVQKRFTDFNDLYSDILSLEKVKLSNK